MVVYIPNLSGPKVVSRDNKPRKNKRGRRPFFRMLVWRLDGFMFGGKGHSGHNKLRW